MDKKVITKSEVTDSAHPKPLNQKEIEEVNGGFINSHSLFTPRSFVSFAASGGSGGELPPRPDSKV